MTYRSIWSLLAAADARHGRLEDLKVAGEEERREGAVPRHSVAARRQREDTLVVVHQNVAGCGKSGEMPGCVSPRVHATCCFTLLTGLHMHAQSRELCY